VGDNAPASPPNKRVTSRVVVLLAGVLTIVLLISFLFRKEGTSELQQTRQRVEVLQQEIERLRAENQQLAEQINSLRSSTFSIEKIAREELGMAREGEVVYVLEAGERGPSRMTNDK
jgi:cell division protein FtsB